MELESIKFHPIDKDIELLPGFTVKKLEPVDQEPLSQITSRVEAFNTVSNQILKKTLKDAEIAEPVEKRWLKLKAKCRDFYKLQHSDFVISDISVNFSDRINERLSEFDFIHDDSVSFQYILSNEESLRNSTKKFAQLIEHNAEKNTYMEMLDITIECCYQLNNFESPNFYPCQFVLIVEAIDKFVANSLKMFNLLPDHPIDFETAPTVSRQLTAIEWFGKISKIELLLPKLMLEITFLKFLEFHPWKNLQEQINLISHAIGGLGVSLSTIFVIAYFVHTVFKINPKNDIAFMQPLLEMYTLNIIYMNNCGFKRCFRPQLKFSYEYFMNTQEPALYFFLRTLITNSDAEILINSIDSFYAQGKPPAFVLKVFIDSIPPRFITVAFPVVLKMIDECDNTLPKSLLMHELCSIIAACDIKTDVVKTTNDIFIRMREYKSSDFIFVAAPLTKYVCRFCQPRHIDLYLDHVMDVVSTNFEKQESEFGLHLSENDAINLYKCVKYAVKYSKNFGTMLESTHSASDLMDYLDAKRLEKIALYILEDIQRKPFKMSDPFAVRVILEQAIIAFHSLSVLSADDVVQKIIAKIEWFLYRVDFDNNIEAHLNFLLAARESFQTNSRLMSVLARIAMRDCIHATNNKIPHLEIALYSLLAYTLCTIPSIENPVERCALFLMGANVALLSKVVSFSETFFDYFVQYTTDLPPTPDLYILLKNSLSFILILPGKQEGDCLEVFRALIKICVRKKWTEDLRIDFALDSIVLGAHMQRTNYLYGIDSIDSNDILYRGNLEFREKVQRVINQMVTRTNQAISMVMGKRNTLPNQALLPCICLRAIASFADNYEFDDDMKKEFKFLMTTMPKYDINQQPLSEVTDLKNLVLAHLRKTYAGNSEIITFVNDLFL